MIAGPRRFVRVVLLALVALGTSNTHTWPSAAAMGHAAKPSLAAARPLFGVTVDAVAGRQPTAEPLPTPATEPSPDEAFGPITFAAGVRSDGKPTVPMASFPEGITKVYGVFSYAGVPAGTSWTSLWTLDGAVYLRSAGSLSARESGTAWSGLFHPGGLPAGHYELRQFLADRMVLEGSFVVEGRPAGQPYFGPIRFAEGMQDDQPVNEHEVPEIFRAGSRQIYAFFDAGNMTTGLPYVREWYREGNLDTRRAETWSGDRTEEYWWAALVGNDALTPGTYELRLYLDGTLAQLASFVVERPTAYLPIAWRSR